MNMIRFLWGEFCKLGSQSYIIAVDLMPRVFDYVITMDADFLHHPIDIPRLLKQAEKGSNFIGGSRYCKSLEVLSWNLSRLLVSKATNKITDKWTKLYLNDNTSGFRFYSKGRITKTHPKLYSQTYEIRIVTFGRQNKAHK